MPEHAPDLAALRARFVSPPGPCPYCGTERVKEVEHEDSVEHWTCPNVPQGPTAPGAEAFEAGTFDADMETWHLARHEWYGSPGWDESLRHASAAELAIWPDADVVAVIDRLAALEAAIRR